MPRDIRRVAVVGAGPAGAVATDALVKEGVNPLTGDADKAVTIPENLPAATPISEAVNSHQYRFSDTAIHENFHSNIPPEIMSYSQEPFPNTLSEQTLGEYGPGAQFRHHAIVREWIEGIFARGGHNKLLELETTVERAVKENREWVLTLRKAVNRRNYWWREIFDAVVVASGHYNVPWFPEIDGLLEFDNKFPGSVRVIVVGASVSSIETIHEILDLVQGQVYASIRGEPIPAYGWVPFEHPKISVKPSIRRLGAETGHIHITDGSYLDNIDHIVFGTGYTCGFPFIPAVQKRVENAYRRLPGVYQHTWNMEDPTLTFLGGGFAFRAYEWQSVAVARFLAGRAKPPPSIPEQLEWERQRVSEKRGGKDYYSIAPEYEGFFEFLRDIAGEPAEGTAGRVLPAFDPKWLEIWAGMVMPRLDSWRRRRKEAEGSLALKVKLWFKLPADTYTAIYTRLS
ncbi:hypothetical protein F66182_7658 [Fusarium sp. NRRL 66182]|nr:hypothetical protein F66182_7658 [Fusarium sp. NRRL 66182]